MTKNVAGTARMVKVEADLGHIKETNAYAGTCFILWVVLWTKMGPLPNSYVEGLTPNVTIFGERAFKESG